jgi:hypothetical protein
MFGWQTMIWGLSILGAVLLFLAIVLIARKLFGTHHGHDADDEIAADNVPQIAPPVVRDVAPAKSAPPAAAAEVLDPASAAPDAAPSRSGPPPSAYRHAYFISYNASQKKDALLVADVLRKEGPLAKEWVQFFDSHRGDNIFLKVNKAIENSQNFIALLCEDYIEDGSWTMEEVSLFKRDCLSSKDLNRKLIVLKCDEILEKNIPTFFKTNYFGTLSGKNEDEKRAEILSALAGGSEGERTPHDEFDNDIPDPGALVGREQEIETIAKYFFDGETDPLKARTAPAPLKSRRILLHAGPGFGKTSLAGKFAHLYRPWFVSACWLPAEEKVPLFDKIVSLGEARIKSGAKPAATLENALATLDVLFSGAHAPHLVIFDNVDPKTVETVDKLLRRLPESVRVILTARFAQWDDIPEKLCVQKLDLRNAVKLLRTRAGVPIDTDLDGCEDGSRSLAIKLGCLPLGLSHAGKLCGNTIHRSFSWYESKLDSRLAKRPERDDYKKKKPGSEELQVVSVEETFRFSRDYAADMAKAKERGVASGDDVIRLADFLSYCAADAIPHSLFSKAIEDEDSPEESADRLDEAMSLLEAAGLVSRDRESLDKNDPSYSMHRLVQRVLRRDTDAEGRSPDVVEKLAPFLDKQLNDEAKIAPEERQLRFRKYFPHLLQALPELDAPDFRGKEASDVLESVSKLVVFALERQYAASAEDEAYPERLPGLLGCFYEIDPLDAPLKLFLTRLRERPKDWGDFRDACLGAENYVLRFALAKALTRAVSLKQYDRREITQLIERPDTLNHFELGGYALKDLYSQPENFGDIDRALLARLAASECYSGGSILGDLLLNLIYQKRDVRKILPPEEGGNRRFWHPIWDHTAFDVNAIRAADYHNRGETPPDRESEDVKAEHVYLLRLQAWQDELQRRHAGDDVISKIVGRYFSIGADPDWADGAEERFKALAASGKLLPLLRLLFGHPLWSVAETAASVVAALLREAKTPEEANAYIQLIEALFEPELPDEVEGSENPWRVRYGALEAAFQIRLHDQPHYATFFKGVRTCYREPISRLRALCAENLLSVMLNASDKQRAAYEDQFKDEIERWLVDEDAWVLEHVYRYFHTLQKRAETEEKGAAFAPSSSVARFMSGKQSPLFAGLGEWWKADREAFLKHIEAQKAKRIRRPAETPAKVIAE